MPEQNPKRSTPNSVETTLFASEPALLDRLVDAVTAAASPADATAAPEAGSV